MNPAAASPSAARLHLLRTLREIQIGARRARAAGGADDPRQTMLKILMAISARLRAADAEGEKRRGAAGNGEMAERATTDKSSKADADNSNEDGGKSKESQDDEGDEDDDAEDNTEDGEDDDITDDNEQAIEGAERVEVLSPRSCSKCGVDADGAAVDSIGFRVWGRPDVFHQILTNLLDEHGPILAARRLGEP